MVTLGEFAKSRCIADMALNTEYEALRREAIVLNGQQYLMMAQFSMQQHAILEKMAAIECTRAKL